MAERDRVGIAAVLAADPELEVLGFDAAAALDGRSASGSPTPSWSSVSNGLLLEHAVLEVVA